MFNQPGIVKATASEGQKSEKVHTLDITKFKQAPVQKLDEHEIKQIYSKPISNIIKVEELDEGDKYQYMPHQFAEAQPIVPLIKSAPYEYRNGQNGFEKFNAKSGEFKAVGNFNLIPIAWLVEITEEEQDLTVATSIRFKVITSNKEEIVECPIGDFNKLWQKICKNPVIKLNSTGKKSNADFEKYVAQTIEIAESNLAYEYCSKIAGWYNILGEWKYLSAKYGNVDSTREVPDVSGKDKKVIFKIGMDILKIGRTPDKIVPIFFYSLLSYMYPFYESAFLPIQFVLTIIGLSNSLKTALCKAIFNPFETDRNKKVFSLDSTQTALQLAAKEARHECLIVDDLYPAGGGSKKRFHTAVENMESVTRLYGDGTGKVRNDWANKKNIVFKPAGTAVMTAESLLGSLSTRTRQLWVTVDNTSFDGRQLNEFQTNPRYLQEFYALFIDFLEQNFSYIEDFVQKSLEKHRQAYKNGAIGSGIKHRRLGRSLFIMLIAIDTWQAFARYCLEDEYVEEEYDGYNAEMALVIENTVRNTQEAVNECNPVTSFMAALNSLIENESIAMTNNREIFAKNYEKFIAFYDQSTEIFWAKPRELFNATVTEINQSGRCFEDSEKNIYGQLKAENISICDGDGYRKKTGFGIKNAKDRKNLLAIKANNLNALKNLIKD